MAKTDDDDIEQEADELLEDIQNDRTRLSDFFDRVLQIEDTTIVAEAVARIADSLTKQNTLRINALKTLIKKRNVTDDDEDGVFDEIGRPFSAEEEGSN